MNPLNPTVEIELGDKTRTMKMDFNALALAEEVVGRSLFNIAPILTQPTVSAITAIVWACLRHEDPNLKLADVRAQIGFHNIGSLRDALIQLVNASFPTSAESEAEVGDTPLEPTPSRRRSKPSKPSASTTSD